MKAPPKGVGQTASLPGIPERPHRRSQGKLPVCPTFAPRFSFFQGGVTGHEGSSERGRANCQFAWHSRKTASKESRQTASLPYPRAAIFILSGRRNGT